MRKKIKIFPLILLFIFLFFLMSFSKNKINSIREKTISCTSFFWQKSSFIKSLFLNVSNFSSIEKNDLKDAQISQLMCENQKLSEQLEAVTEWLLFEQRIDDEFNKFKKINKRKEGDLYWKDFFQRRSEELKKVLELQLQSLPARVVFRSTASWESSLWINVGYDDNEKLGRLIVAKNSPVVVGRSLVGVIEKVYKNKSRVRLITDSGLTLSVRAIRGEEQDRFLYKIATEFYDHSHKREDLFESNDEKDNFYYLFNQLLKKITHNQKDYFLAKGEISGSSNPLWKIKSSYLKGVGFNYDYPDKEGPARDLRDGKILKKIKSIPEGQEIIKEGDLLMTTGMDGVFSEGLYVATVTKRFKLKEGDYFFNIKAKPTAKNIEDLSTVFVMPPLNAES